MQSLLRNPFRRRKSNNKSTEPAANSEIQQQRLTTLEETDAEQQLQDSDQEGGGDSAQETLVRIPGVAVVNLVEAGEEVSDSVQLGSGEFSIARLVQGNTGIALFVKVGEDLQWPLTKDEPTLKLDSRHYLFSIRPPPDKEATDEDKAEERENDKDSSEILNYGVTFADEEGLDSLDSFLEQHSCLSLPAESISGAPAKATRCTCIPWWKRLNPRLGKSEGAYWTALAPRVEDYNGVVAKAIAEGSGQIIKGLFLCSNAYTSQVRKGGEFVRGRVKKATAAEDHEKKKGGDAKRSSHQTKKNIRRVKNLSRMTEKLTEDVLAGIITVSGAVTAPVVGSKAGQKFFSTLPGDVILASLDAFNQILDAAELAGKDAISATSEVTVEIVSHSLGEDAGEVTSDTLAVGGHAMGTAWNVFKIQKTIDPVTNGRLSASALKVVKLKKTSDAIRTASKTASKDLR